MDRGYMYIARGNERFFEEAKNSVRSLRSADRDSNVTIITDKESEGKIFRSFFDNIIVMDVNYARGMSERMKGFLMKVKAMSEYLPYKKNFFVDTDTYFVENCRYLFDILDYNDICIAHDTNSISNTKMEKNTIRGHKEYNTGVILMDNNEKVSTLLSKWEKILKENYEILSGDQPAFMMALLQSSVEVYVLRNLWNARSIHKNRFAGSVKIVHGRHQSISRIARRINVSKRPRLWIPEAEVCMYNGMKLSDMLRLLYPLVRSYIDTSRLKFLKKVINKIT